MVGLGIVGLSAVGLVLSGAPAAVDTTSFLTPGASTFTVPAGVCSVTVTLNGANGGDGPSLGAESASVNGGAPTPKSPLQLAAGWARPSLGR